MMSFTRYEMETTINYNAEEKTAILYTRDKAVMRRLDKLVAEFPDIYKLLRETDIDKTYSFPKKYAIPRRPRVLSDKQREERRDRLAKAREKKETESILDPDDDLYDEDDILDDDEEESVI